LKALKLFGPLKNGETSFC
jgi:hypothetical protein